MPTSADPGVKIDSGNDIDSGVVEEICGYVTGKPPQSFFLFAGAGSGKTRTLVEVLRRLTGVAAHDQGALFARALRSRGQSVRVITYTKNAVSVINGRLGDNDLTSVSTIHTFCWELIAGFNGDIREALIALKQVELEAAQKKAQAKKNGESARDLANYAEIEAEADAIRLIDSFIYHPDRNTYGLGALQHTQVLAVAGWLLIQRPTLRSILIDQHPVILIDESQDTMKGVIDALLEVAEHAPSRLTLGLLGDHRQRIYAHGHGDLSAIVPATWATPKLQMNHRSQYRIVELINRIWEADIEGRTQAKTGVRQHARREKAGGVVRIFVGESGLASDEKIRREALCAQFMATATSDSAWKAETRGYQVLSLEHRLAARRGDFLDVFTAMDLIDPEAASPQGNGENKGPAAVQALLRGMSELADCVDAEGNFDEFAAMNTLQRHGSLDALPADSVERRRRLSDIHDSVEQFAKALSQPGASIREVISPLMVASVIEADGRLVTAFGDTSPVPAAPAPRTAEAKEDRRRRGWDTLFRSSWSELSRYRRYMAGEASLATHQVVKGSEFEHVMVIMDDEDAGGFLFSYDKLFGSTKLSDTDIGNMADNKETTIDRTLRLLYVTSSRARESLALVLWAKNPAAALTQIASGNWFDAAEIVPMPL
jgi:DNA helicase II / ATP-dependent DNA helicase PcrA